MNCAETLGSWSLILVSVQYKTHKQPLEQELEPSLPFCEGRAITLSASQSHAFPLNFPPELD